MVTQVKSLIIIILYTYNHLTWGTLWAITIIFTSHKRNGCHGQNTSQVVRSNKVVVGVLNLIMILTSEGTIKKKDTVGSSIRLNNKKSDSIQKNSIISFSHIIWNLWDLRGTLVHVFCFLCCLFYGKCFEEFFKMTLSLHFNFASPEQSILPRTTVYIKCFSKDLFCILSIWGLFECSDVSLQTGVKRGSGR